MFATVRRLLPIAKPVWNIIPIILVALQISKGDSLDHYDSALHILNSLGLNSSNPFNIVFLLFHHKVKTVDSIVHISMFEHSKLFPGMVFGAYKVFQTRVLIFPSCHRDDSRCTEVTRIRQNVCATSKSHVAVDATPSAQTTHKSQRPIK